MKAVVSMKQPPFILNVLIRAIQIGYPDNYIKNQHLHFHPIFHSFGL